MIQSFRRALKSWLMLGFLALAVIAIVVTGFGTGGVGGGQTGATGDAIATVGDEKILETEFADIVNRQLTRAREQQPELDMGRFLAGGVFEEILSQRIIGKALVFFGVEQGLAVSPRMIDREIAGIAAFRNVVGQFDPQIYQQALQAQGLTERQLRDDFRESLMQRQLMMPIAGGARVPQSLATQYASLLLERRRGTIGVVPSEAMSQGINPTDAEVNTYYRAQQLRYTVPERRVLRYAVLGPEQLGQAAQPSEQEIAAYYQQNGATYGARETRTLQQVVLQSEAEARSLAGRVRGGNLAQAAGGSLIDLGAQNREQFANVTSPQVANAVFTAADGAVVGPIRSELGWHVVKVSRINRTPARSLASARGEIVQQLSQRKLQEALGDLVNRIEEKIGEASFEEIVRDERLTLRETPAITAAGAAPGVQWQAPQELQPMLRSAFELDPEELEPIVETITANQRYALVSVARVIPAAPAPLQQIRQQVRADLIRQRASERAQAVAASIVAKINAGMPVRQAYAQAGMPLPAPQPVNARRLDIARGDQQVPPPLAMLFSIPQGRARQLQAPNGAGWFIVHLEQRTPGDARTEPGLAEATRTQFANVIGEEFAEQFARSVQGRVEVNRNQEAIQRTRQRLLGVGAAQ
jgi:peptidyl-prolyl cis-trans isomerase D